MREQVHGGSSTEPDQRDERRIALALAIAIVICLVTFIWIFVSIEPFMSDFTGSDVILTPESGDPLASPSIDSQATE